jgi:hypothetical protein
MSTTGDPDLAGAYEGERIFLIGNGPSLAETPLDALEDEYTMAMNRIDLIYDAVDWRPDFYLCMRNINKIRDELKDSIEVHLRLNRTRCFLDKSWEEEVGPQYNPILLSGCDVRQSDTQSPNNLTEVQLYKAGIEKLEQYWSYDPTVIIYRFHAMYIAAQLVAWMGFDEVYILGADLYPEPNYILFNNDVDPINYKGQVIKYLRDAYKNESVVTALINGVCFKCIDYLIKFELLAWISKFGKQHFDQQYANYTIHTKPRNIQMIKSHIIIKRLLKANDVNIYNATCGGNLEVYQRIDLRQILNESNCWKTT